MIKSALNARLLTVADMVRQDATFADIGTDHAYLPLFLLDEGRISHAFCSDINRGPLDSAVRNARERGRESRMTFILTDGAAALSGRGITDYAICGMGGELIADIIDRAPQLRDGSVNLILQPMTRQAHLRRYLAAAGFSVSKESYSFDGGKYYVCLLATYTAERRVLSNIEAELGFSGAEIIGDSARVGYLKAKLSALTRVARGKRRGGESNIPEEEVISAIRDIIK